MKLAVGFITYNKDSFRYLSQFLPSLIKETKGRDLKVKILAVDNSEYSLENIIYLESKYPEIEIIRSGENIGFAKAYNSMIDRAKDSCEYFLVINPDIFVEENAIVELVKKMDEDSSLAAVSPKILHWNFKGNNINNINETNNIIDTLGIIKKKGLKFVDKYQGRKDKNIQASDDEIIAPSGACGLYRVSALNKIRDRNGFFDERMFLYKEDVDLAYKFFKKGLKCRTVFSATVLHDRSLKASRGFFLNLLSRRNKSRFGREQSFLNQHLIYFKYFREQSFLDKLIVIFRILAAFVFVLIFERFLLKNYSKLVSILIKRDK